LDAPPKDTIDVTRAQQITAGFSRWLDDIRRCCQFMDCENPQYIWLSYNSNTM
jgi:hypothetical protein